MNIGPPETETLENYREYANSTLHLNQALNSELSNCYDRIARMIKDSANAEKARHQLLEEINTLNHIISQYSSHNTQKQSLSAAVQTESEPQSVLDLDVESSWEVQPHSREQALNQEIESLLMSKLELQIQLEIARTHHSSLPQQTLNKYKCQIQKLSQRNSQIFNHNQYLFQQLNFIKLEHKKLFEESAHQIQEQNNKIKLLQYDLQNLRSQTVRIRYTEPSVEQKSQEAKLRENSKRIQELEEKIGLLEAQNRHFKESIKETQRRYTHVRQHTPADTELKTLKEEYSKIMKQNMLYAEINSKLQKNSVMFTRELDLLRRDKAELGSRVNDLMGEITQSHTQLIKSQTRIQELNSTLSLRESECSQMKRSLNSEMFQKLGVEMRSAREILTSRRKEVGEVPVRDSSVMVKSRSTTRGMGLKEAPTMKKL